MTVRVEDPALRSWAVRRSVVRGRDGSGHRWRWRGPEWLGDLARLVELGELADVPVIGIAFAVIALVVLSVVLMVLLPFLLLGIAEALFLAVLAGFGLVAATLVGRPLLVRAELPDGSTHLAWAVKGWSRSREVRDTVVEAIRSGTDLREPGRVGADLVYDAEAAPRPPDPTNS